MDTKTVILGAAVVGSIAYSAFTHYRLNTLGRAFVTVSEAATEVMNHTSSILMEKRFYDIIEDNDL